MLKLERKAVDFLCRHVCLFGALAVFVLSVWVRVSVMDGSSGDLEGALLVWYRGIEREGFSTFLREGDYNYNIFYMSLLGLLTRLPVEPELSIKLLSIVFDCAQAILLALLALRFGSAAHRKLQALGAFALGCLSPLVVLNSSYWAQCDSIYSFFTLLALSMLLLQRYPQGLLWLGVAGAVKLQAWFLLPVFCIVYCIRRRFSVLWFALLPAVFWLSGIPAYCAGMPLNTPFVAYVEQFQSLNMNYPNWYVFFNGPYDVLKGMGYILALAVLGAMAVWLISARRRLTAFSLLLLCVWVNYACTLFLPGIHERYGYVAELLLGLVLLLRPGTRLLAAFCMLYGTAMATYANYFYGTPGGINYWLTAINYIGFLLLTVQLVRAVRDEGSADDAVWRQNAQAVAVQETELCVETQWLRDMAQWEPEEIVCEAAQPTAVSAAPTEALPPEDSVLPDEG